jgi:diguanylate cyclase (GGDEF)-like protein
MTSPTSTTDFEQLFESAPISLWLEDYSALKARFDIWRSEGVVDFAAHMREHPELLSQCSALFKVLKVNRKTLEVFSASDQAELLQRLPEIFRGDMFDNLLPELEHLWRGELSFTNQSVNYALDGRRLAIRIHVRVLQGYESTWGRVMVSLEDITLQVEAQTALQVSAQYATDLFEHSPVSLWVEDFSAVKALLDEVRSKGIQDFRVFLSVHPDFITRCMAKIRVLDVNQQTLLMFSADSKSSLMDNLHTVFRDEMRNSFAEQLYDLWTGKTVQFREVVNYSLNGDLINIHMQFSVLAGHETTWDRVLVSLVDITARKKAEAYLEYLGKHDSLTRLGNRAFYVEELNRLSRRGPWPLCVMAIDLNGLKRINDQQGHAAGDGLLRRAGEVLASAVTGLNVCLARIGGDEFTVLMPDANVRSAQTLADRIQSMVELNNQFYPGCALSMAIGIAVCEGPGQMDQTLIQADRAMFDVKDRYYADNELERRRL